METKNLTEIDPLVLLHTRNHFYRGRFYMVFGIFLLSLLANIILGFVLNYIIQNPPRPYYFAADDNGRLIQEVPVTKPNMSTEDVMAWAVRAVEAVNNYDFVNYREQLQNAQKYFTDYGWRKFMEGLRSSNNLLAVTNRKFIITAKVVDKPKILVEGELEGAYAWKLQMQVLVTSLTPPNYDDASKILNPWIVTVIIQRQNMLQSYQGLGIAQYIGALAHS